MLRIKYNIYRFLVNITFGRMREHFFRKKNKYKNILYPLNFDKSQDIANNTVIIHCSDGEILYNKKIKGVTIDFKGKNSIVEIWEPYNFSNCYFSLGDESEIKIRETKYIINELNINMAHSKNTKFSIGRDFTLNSLYAELLWEKDNYVVIGDDCLFSTNIIIRPDDSHSIYDDSTKKLLNHYTKGITIGNHVWIGQEAAILKEVDIPNNCVVGFRSTVTRNDFKENCCIAGTPAKIIKENINWHRTSTDYYLEQNFEEKLKEKK